MQRHDGRDATTLRTVRFEPDYLQNPLASVMIHMGRTRVLCTASHDEKIPGFLSGSGEGWITAEYSMIPAATDTRATREIRQGRASGRTMEIQRLIGRAMRSVVDRRGLGERSLWIDCEVLQADGGTRCAAITGGFTALCLGLRKLQQKEKVRGPVLTGTLAAISVGVLEGTPILDLDYVEDAAAEVDMNIVRTDDGRYVELQGTAESTPFDRERLDAMLRLADHGIDQLLEKQREILGDALDQLLIKR